MANLIRRGLVTNAFAPRGRDGGTLSFKRIRNISELTSAYGSSTAIPLTVEVESGTGGQGSGGGIIFHLVPTITDVTDSAGTITGDSFTTETSLTFSGNGMGNETIQLLNAGSPIGASYTIPQGDTTWSITLNGLSYASYDITAQGDLQGDIKTSAAVNFLVEQALVAGTIVEASDSQTTITQSGGRLGEAQFSFTGTADPNATNHVLVDSNGNTISPISVATDGSFTVGTIVYAGEGSYSYAVRSTTDNQDVIGSNFVVSINFYMIAPTIDSIFDGAQTLAAGSTVDVADFDVIGTAEAGSTVTLSDGTSTLGTTTADAQGDWTISLTGQVDGTYTFDATATASDGDTQTSANFGFTISIPQQSSNYHDVFSDNTFSKTLTETTTSHSNRETSSVTSFNGTTLILDGTGDYLAIDNDNRFNPQGGDWSISMDLKAKKWNANPFTVFSKMDEYNTGKKAEGLSFTLEPSGGPINGSYVNHKLRLQHADDTNEDGVNDYSGNFTQLTGTNTMYTDDWFKLSAVYDNTNGELRFYVNGSLFETFTGYSVPGDTTAATRIGAHSFWKDTDTVAMGYAFAGQIENLHVYNGAWTVNDIRSLPVRSDIVMPAPTP